MNSRYGIYMCMIKTTFVIEGRKLVAGAHGVMDGTGLQL